MGADTSALTVGASTEGTSADSGMTPAAAESTVGKPGDLGDLGDPGELCSNQRNPTARETKSTGDQIGGRGERTEAGAFGQVECSTHEKEKQDSRGRSS